MRPCFTEKSSFKRLDFSIKYKLRVAAPNGLRVGVVASSLILPCTVPAHGTALSKASAASSSSSGSPMSLRAPLFREEGPNSLRANRVNRQFDLVSAVKTTAKIDQSMIQVLSDSQVIAKPANLESESYYSPQLPNQNRSTEESYVANGTGKDSENVSNSDPTILFQVAEADASAANSDVPEQSKPQQIIATLTDSVGKLSEQLSRKDQKIDVFEKQITELKDYIGGQVFEQSTALVSLQQAQLIATNYNADKTSITTAPLAVAKATSFWQWLLFSFFCLSALTYILRVRISSLSQSLNLFGANDQLDSNNRADRSLDLSGLGMAQSLTLESALDRRLRDYPSVTVNDKDLSGEDLFEGNSSFGLADDVCSQGKAVLERQEKENKGDIDDLSFDQLLDEKDFEFARELLDFARYNEINDERYHCERLRLFKNMQDKDGFYKFYYGIESKIPTFSANLQTQISQLVVLLAQR